MRLHRLRLQAFLAFPGEEEVDFDALGEAGLFLLQGPTGAGKTSLLDAVCFALYGAVPGVREGGTSLRSDHATPDVLTEVELEATLRGQRIRVLRAPEQERPKVRGEGMTREAHRVTVWAVDPDGGERVLATRHGEAEHELGALLGMTRDQFCQVVLLPQGGFARFLRADSTEREALLRELFDVGRFAEVEEWLKRRRRDAESAYGEALRVVRDVVARVAQEAGEEPPEDWESDLGVVGSWLEEQLVVAEASATTAAEGCKLATEAREQATAALAAGTELARRQAAHQAAVEALDAWESRREARDAAAEELRLARAAVPAAPLISALAERDAASSEADAAAEAARREAPATGQTSELRLFDDGGGVAGSLRRTAGRMRTRAGEVQALLDREEALASAKREVEQLAADAAKASRACEEHTAAVHELDERRRRLAADAEAAREAAAVVPGLRESLAAAQLRARRGQDRDRLVREVETAESDATAAREAHLTAREALVDVQRRRLDGMAATLAAQLVEGGPCPVCGAVEHPSPAHLPAAGDPDLDLASLPDEAAERRAAEAVDAAERRREATDKALAELRAQLAAAREVASDAPIEKLAAAHAAAAQALAQAEARAVNADALAAEMAKLDTELEARTTARRDAEVAKAQAEAQARTRAATLADEERALTEARGPHASVAELVAHLVAGADRADAAADAVEVAERCSAERNRAHGAAKRAAREAGFDSVEAAQAALLPAEDAAALEQRIAAWDAGLVERRTAAAAPELVEASKKDAPDLPALTRVEKEAVAHASDAERLAAATERRHRHLGELRGRLESALAAARPARETLSLVREVADLANGTSASNRLRMRLSAYVLAARLEEVAAAATTRLQQMSGGRFSLEHADDAAKGNRRGGLDLRVVDAWTGRTRPPSSLSGGETFIASLALALGLADVVSADAGGARLETLFVDEGFGSLDDEGTLDEVLDVLDALRDGGRVVGIVSHVVELRQ
uniref:AAA family ATPase n=1 Tax=Conexibacter sp. SYSU D00693 TaxID=2812560 RepID=UPI00196AC0A4